VDADQIRRVNARNGNVLRHGGAQWHFRSTAPHPELQVHTVIHLGADLGRAHGLVVVGKQRASIAAAQLIIAVLQVKGFILIQDKLIHIIALFRFGVFAHSIAAVTGVQLVVRPGFAAQHRQGFGGFIHNNAVAQFAPHAERLHFLPFIRELGAAVKGQAVVGAGFRQHPNFPAPVKHGGEREMEVFL